MNWAIKYSDTALKELKKLDRGVAREILNYLDEKIAVLDDPATAGKALKGRLSGFLRYRVRDVRVICFIDRGTITVLVLHIGHRKNVYDDEAEIASRAATNIALLKKASKTENED